jgi:hypothetical protein
MHDLHLGGLATYALKRGGTLHPLLLPKSVLGNETGIMNPSIFLNEGKIILNIRHVNYILYHSEGKRFPHQWGPLVYLHPENDVALKTHNVMCELDESLNITSAHRVDMKLDTSPTWNFVGLEDARLFNWDDKIYLCGVRRDCYDDKGKGRMELCHIQRTDKGWEEVSRHPIPAPGDDSSYCEKNWMPVLDMPYHFVKWCNPTQVVKFNIEEGTTEIAFEDTSDRKPWPKDFRGGSQVMRINENQRMAFVHETNLLRDPFGRKDGDYGHRVLIWDNDWNIIHVSKKFHFLGTFYDHVTNTDFNIEFVTGAAILKNDLLVSFGFQDNASFVLRIPLNVFNDFLTKG